MKLKLQKSVFIYVCLLSFVFITTSALATSKLVKTDIKSPVVTQVSSQKSVTKQFISLPTLVDSASFPIISAQAVLAVDLDSSIAFYEKNPDMPLLPASTTKIIAALVAMDYYPTDAVLTVGNIKKEGQTMGLVYGEEITVEDLLYGLLISSANDAAEVLAENYTGGRNAFVAAMNEKADELNLTNSTFTNPAGLDSAGHISTARDLIRVSEYAMRNPYFAQIVGTAEAKVMSADGKIEHRLVNVNELVGSVEGVLGVKTGWTENARENLVTYIERDKRRIMIALMGSQDRFGETRELIDWIFENYQWQEVGYP